MRRGAIVITSIAMTIAAEPAGAQSARQVSAADSGRAYVWIDGSYQSVGLPSVGNFGVQGLLPATTTPGGSEKHDPRLNGYGINGGIGYVFAPGVFSPLWGSNVRIELSGNYVRADGTSFAERAPVTNVNLTALPLMGVAFGITGCGGATCVTRSSLSSDYTAWNIDLKAKSDFWSGAWTVSPSIAIVGGRADTSQHLAQQTFLDGAFLPLVGYDMNAALKWTDVGAKLGLETRYEFANGLNAGLIGSAGLVHRAASMSADSSILLGVPVPRLSAVQDGRSTVPLLLNLEARVTARVMPNVTAKGFVGLNYDSDVPGLEAPQSLAFVSTGIPARIKFDAATSYYAGGGLTVSFGP